MNCRSFSCFFSSRRRHTRYWRDWSSDVCSSDLEAGAERHLAGPVESARVLVARLADPAGGADEADDPERDDHEEDGLPEIGRASCRERVKISVGAECLKKKRETMTNMCSTN